jgi:pyruvate/2-oxoglutarate dehydrogenase complex dihydrolipoamide acyltransferase (E2) component
MRHPLVLPELGLDGHELTVSLWLVEVGSDVTQGDRLIEIMAGEVTIDLAAPASGVLIETLVGEDDPVHVGHTLGFIESS